MIVQFLLECINWVFNTPDTYADGSPAPSYFLIGASDDEYPTLTSFLIATLIAGESVCSWVVNEANTLSQGFPLLLTILILVILCAKYLGKEQMLSLFVAECAAGCVGLMINNFIFINWPVRLGSYNVALREG